MPDLLLGVSTWCFNGVKPGIASILDGGVPLTPNNTQAVRDFFRDITDALLDSDVRSVEVWNTAALADEGVIAELERLSARNLIHSLHAPFGPKYDLSSPDAGIRKAGVDACAKVAEVLAKLGGRTLVVHGSARVAEPDKMPDYASRSAKSIGLIADECGKFGVQVAVEVLAGHAVGSSGPELCALMELIGRPNVGVCIDVNHVFPPDRLIPTVHLLGPRILTLHISDYDGTNERHWLPGQGIMDYAGLVPALRAVGYPGPFLYEVRMDAPTIPEAVAQIQENYRKLIPPGDK